MSSDRREAIIYHCGHIYITEFFLSSMIHLNRLYVFSVNTTRAQSIMCTGWNICSCELQLYQSTIHLRTTLSFQTQLFLCTIVQLIIIFEYICTVNDFFEYICTVNVYFRVHLYTKKFLSIRN